MRNYIIIYLNGQKKLLRGAEVFMTLSNYLRSNLMVGTKVVCEEGDCGACTVLRGEVSISDHTGLEYRSINSCITFMHLLDRTHIITIEGAGLVTGGEKVQNAMVQNHAAQCGFCTPGIVMSLIDMAEKRNDVNQQNVKNCLSGNLCRCTGYDAIINAGINIDAKDVHPLSQQFNFKMMQDDFNSHIDIPVEIKNGQDHFYSPVDIKKGLEIKVSEKALVKSSATDLGVQINKERIFPTSRISLSQISELYSLSHTSKVLKVGAKVTLTQLQNYIERIIPEFHDLLSIFASPQIKNSATLIGNIANASPIGDTIPFLMVTNSSLEIVGLTGSRMVKMRDFYTGYKQFDLLDDEIISNVHINIPTKDDKLKLYKVSKRKDLDISCVTAGFKMQLENNKISDIKIALGGVAATVLNINDIENKMSGEEFSLETFEKFGKETSQNINPMTDVRGSEKFRRILVKNMFIKFYNDVVEENL